MNRLVGIVEAVIFASGSAISKGDIFAMIPEEYSKKDFADAIEIIKEKFSGESGIVLEVFNDKLQFASSHIYGDIVSAILQPVKEKELTSILMECLAIVAYRQPVTRGEIEEIRGVSADYALTTLSRCNMIKQKGFKNSPGHPALFVTSDEFLKKFGLASLDEMPDYATIMQRLAESGNFNEQSEGLYREVTLAENFADATTSFQEQQSQELDEYMDSNAMPDFLEGEDVASFEGDKLSAENDSEHSNTSEAENKNVAAGKSELACDSTEAEKDDSDAFEEDSDIIGV